ncbi:MAG: glycosyltransferase family 4 protein [Bacteroidales bacterium]|jgi:glycosyltransferase involved in cell wall biosynthesis|nr:glycosyltransferase family 4 protein [Bacteroidales bacterium]
MKILLISTFDCSGGAAVAANRLMKALRKQGVDAKILVRDKQTDDENVISVNTSWLKRKINFIRFAWERWIIFCHNRFNRKDLFRVSIANTGTDICGHSLMAWADVVHLHWINQGFLSLNDIKKLLKTGKSVVWTMHDMWPCTGICHHAWGCENFKSECGNCPFLSSKKTNDLSYRIFQNKKHIFQSNIHFVTVSIWLKSMALKNTQIENSDISVIPNVVDTTLFYPADKQIARKQLSFPLDKKIVLMGAAKLNDPIKGFTYLQQALSILKEQGENILLILFGSLKDDPVFLSSISVEYISTGLIRDTSTLARLYVAADVTVVSSLYETFGQTLIEAMACGCPVVSFDNSGQTDIIEHKVNGYLARYKDAEDLACGIRWVLSEASYEELSKNAIGKVKQVYDEAVIARQYIELYGKVLS